MHLAFGYIKNEVEVGFTVEILKRFVYEESNLQKD